MKNKDGKSGLGFRLQLDPSMNSLRLTQGLSLSKAGSTLSGSAELTVESKAEWVETRNRESADGPFSTVCYRLNPPRTKKRKESQPHARLCPAA